MNDKVNPNYKNDIGVVLIIGEPRKETIMDVLKEKNVHQIRNILLDDSLFDIAADPDGSGRGLNPYDAANSALAVNFNTVHIIVSPKGAVRSAEPQTPTLPLMKKMGKGLKPGAYRLNISSDKKKVCRGNTIIKLPAHKSGALYSTIY